MLPALYINPAKPTHSHSPGGDTFDATAAKVGKYHDLKNKKSVFYLNQFLN